LHALDEVPVRRIRCFVDDMAFTLAKLPSMSLAGTSRA